MSCVKSPLPAASSQVVEVFSALTFYSESSAGIPRARGVKTAQLHIPTSGIHHVAQSSLEWVDGFFAQSEACDQLISAIERREVAVPLISHTSHSMGTRCAYTSAEILANSNESIIAACGLVQPLAEIAFSSTMVSCPACNSASSRVLTPLALGDLLLRDFDSLQVSLTASSNDERFLRWATNMGLSVLHDSSHNAPVVTLDAGLCSASFIARLSSILRSAWSIPRIAFLCRSGQTSHVYAPQGWCSTCASLIPPPDRAALTQLLKTGWVYSEFPADTFKLERSLTLAADLRIDNILASPLHALTASGCTVLQELRTLLCAFELGKYPLSTPLSTLPVEDIAILSIAVSLYRSRSTPSTVLVDLPSGILHRKQSIFQAATSLREYSTHAIILLGDPFATPEKSGDPTTTTAALNNTADAKAESSRGTANNPGEDSGALDLAVDRIPLFPRRDTRTRTLGDELGLLQGIAQLYAASIDARCVGLTVKDFFISAARSHQYMCRDCKGLGITLRHLPGLPRPHAKPCGLCHGKRFREPVASTLFRGVPYAVLLNRPIALALDTLRTLPRTRDLLECLQLLDLAHLPLGMPVALLSSSELRRVMVLKSILAARTGDRRKIVIQAPHAGFTKAQREGVKAVQRSPSLADRCLWAQD